MKRESYTPAQILTLSIWKSVMLAYDTGLGKLEIDNLSGLYSLHKGGYVFSNHVSNFDPVIYGDLMFDAFGVKNCSAVVKPVLKNIPGLGRETILPYMRAKELKKLRKELGNETAKEYFDAFNKNSEFKAKEFVKDGIVSLVFPKGTRSESYEPLSLGDDKLISSLEKWLIDEINVDNKILDSKSMVFADIQYRGFGNAKVTFSDAMRIGDFKKEYGIGVNLK